MPETQYPISRRIDSGINPISAKELIRHLQNAIERLECFTDGENDEVYPIISMSADMPHSVRTSHDGRHESLIFEIHVFDNVKTYIELRGM